MPGAPEGSCCQRSRLVLEECSGEGDSALSLALARREWLRKVTLAVSQKSSAHPGIEWSGLSSRSSGSAAGDFSRDAPGKRSRRARSVSRTAEVAREGAGAGTRCSAGLS